jgi:hypothetical protein
VVDTSAKDQCVDLAVAWCDFLGIPRVFPFQYAYQIFTSFGDTQAKYFDRIYNQADNKPIEGDIPVWKWEYNYAGGHVGVATGRGVSEGKSTDWFSCFVQNDPVGEKCQIIENYDFDYVLGWLRPKNLITSTVTPNADSYVYAAKDAITSARNSVNTGSQVGDPDFKTKMATVKTKAQEIISLIG